MHHVFREVEGHVEITHRETDLSIAMNAFPNAINLFRYAIKAVVCFCIEFLPGVQTAANDDSNAETAGNIEIVCSQILLYLWNTIKTVPINVLFF